MQALRFQSNAHHLLTVKQNCHSKAWKLFHKNECKILRDSPNLLMSHLALYRLLFWKTGNYISDKVAAVLSLLEDHFDEYSDTEAGDVLFEFASSIRNTANPSVALNVVLRLLPAVSLPDLSVLAGTFCARALLTSFSDPDQRHQDASGREERELWHCPRPHQLYGQPLVSTQRLPIC